jgi:formylglycine-generating enzyme required for sulfatase activity/serine/threonine protein kinase
MAARIPKLADLSNDDRQVLESWLVEFDQRWDERFLASRVDGIPAGSSWRLPALAEMVKIDLERQWQLGRQVSLESYLVEFPELGSPTDVSVDLIQAEYEVRRHFGAPLTLADYQNRFPHQAAQFGRLIAQGGPALSRHSAVAAASRSSAQAVKSEESPERIPEQFGRYRIIKRLGQGGMGSVYLAQDTHLERLVALKVPDFGKHEGPEARRRFLEEARTAATLDHPYLCPVYDAGDFDGQLYLTMAYIEGQSLAASVGDAGWPQRQVAALVGKLALALQEAHNRKVIHRDLKPANVMIKTTAGRREPVIVDFGLARRDDPQEQRLTRLGQVMGTLAYMAPEQIRGDLKEIGPACDIYALGVILYELLTGRLPFNGSGLAVAAQILTEAPLPLSAHRSDLHPALEAICLRAMARMVKDRYASMAELAAALTGFLHSSSTSPRPQRSADLPSSPSSTSGKRPHPAGSDSLIGQFLAQLAGTEESASSIPIPEPLASLAPAPKRRPAPWPLIVTASVLSVVFLSFILYVVTDKRRNMTAVDGRTLAIKADTKIVAGPNPFENEKPATTEKVAARSSFKNEKPATTEKVAARSSFENEKSAKTEKVAEPNPWPEAVAEAGHLLPLWDRTLAMSRDCRRLAVATQTDLKIVAAPDASKIFEMKGQRPPNGGNAPYIWAAAFSPDDKYIAISFNDFPARIWEIATGKEVCQTSLLPGTALVYSPNGKRLAVAGRQYKVVSVGDSATGKKLFDLGPHSALTDSVAFSPDGMLVASGSGADPKDEWGVRFGTGSDLRVWDLQTGNGFGLDGHPMRVNAVTFSPDGTRLASASIDKTVKVWDLSTKKCVATFTEHKTPVRFVRFSPDGRLIASTAEGKAVRVWDASTGKVVDILRGLRFRPDFVQFSVAGRWIYSGSRSNLKAWESPISPMSGGTVGLSTRAGEHPAQAAVKKPSVQKLDQKGAEADRRNITETARAEGALAKDETNPTAGAAAVKSAGLAKRKPKVTGNAQKLVAESIGMTLRLIPAGEFMMGSSQEDATPREKPRHKVRISPFYLAVTEVTQGQYKAMMGNNPSHFSATGDGKDQVAGRSTDQLPVEFVSWHDAVRFCDTLSEREGRMPFYSKGARNQASAENGPGYRLPTEAEWEYACRAGAPTRYSFGDAAAALKAYAWFQGNSAGMTHAVAEKLPNGCGLYDMHGNVSEWCSDLFEEAYYQRAPANNPLGPAAGLHRVIRGGAMHMNPPGLRSAARYEDAPNKRHRYRGFRVAVGTPEH